MRISLGFKLGIIYLILITLAMLALGTFVLNYFEETFIAEKRSSLLVHGNVIANRSAPFLRDEVDYQYLGFLARDTSEQIGNRVILLNAGKEVIADSAVGMVGDKMDNPQVNLALTGRTAGDAHYLEQFGWVYYLAVPIAAGQELLGVAFIAADINEIYEQLATIRERLLMFGFSTGIVIFAISLLLSKIITIPINRLQQGVQKMAAGEYGFQVPSSGKDELSQLAHAFNIMSKKIEKEDEIRKQFVANASHELKSPLAGMKALIESVVDTEISEEEVKEILLDMNGEIDRLNKLVTDLLALSKIENNKNILDLEEVAMGELVTEVIKRVEPLAKKKKIAIKVKGDPNIYWQLDGEMMLRAIYNVLDNAVKYSPPESEIKFNFYQKEHQLYFEVADRGMGIPEHEQDKIFDRFYRIDKARSRSTGGSGLGLSLVKEIVALHEGEIEIVSKQSQGTTFILKI